MATRHLCLYRNKTIGTDRAAAKTALETALKGLNDGEIAINRYKDGDNVKVLIGFASSTDSSIQEKKPTIFDADAIPADVQKKLDEITTGDGNGSIAKAIADAKSELIGSGSDVAGSNTINGAKKYTDNKIAALTYNDTADKANFVTAVSETGGKITVSRGAVTSNDKTIVIGNGTDGGIDVKANIDGTTIIADKGSGKMSVASSALTQYVGENAIKVSNVDETKNTKTVSLSIKNGDKVLTQDANGLATTLSLVYDSVAKTITLKGSGKNVLSTINTNDFVKDGMLNDAKAFMATAKTQEITFKGGKHSFENLTVNHHYIGFEFKTSDGVKTTYTYDNLDATDIIDTYKAGNGLVLNDHTFSVNKNASAEKFLTVDSNGINLSGVQDAIDKAAAGAKNTIAVKNDGRVHVSAKTETDGHITYTISENDIAQKSLLDAEVTRAKTAEDKIEASVGLSEDGSHKTPTGNYTKAATTIVEEISALDAQIKTNADNIETNKNAAANYTVGGVKLSDTPKLSSENAIVTKGLKITLKVADDSNLVNGADGLKLADTIDCGIYGDE